MTILLRVIFVLVLSSTIVWAGDFWDDKDFSRWNPKELAKMMTKSPWSKEVTVTVSSDSGGSFADRLEEKRLQDTATLADRKEWEPEGADVARPREELNRAQSGSERLDSVGKRAGDLRRARVRSTKRRFELIVSWRSALPVRQAMLRKRLGDSTEADAVRESLVEREEEFYVVAVSGFPYDMGTILRKSEAVMAGTVLKRKKGSILPVQSAVERRAAFVDEKGKTIWQTGLDLLLFFPKSANITVEDKDVELIVKVGQFELKKKFKLKDMVINGKLYL